jgi:hypothetical protein
MPTEFGNAFLKLPEPKGPRHGLLGMNPVVREHWRWHLNI